MKSNDRITVIILGLLTQEPMSGYALKKRMEVSVSNFVRPSFGNIYPTLKKLAAQGALKEVNDAGPHAKTVYATTPHGVDMLVNWLKSPIKESEPFLLREYFFDAIDKGTQRQLIREYIALLRAIQERYHAIETQFGKVMGRFPYQTLKYGKSHVAHDIAWYENLLKEN